MTMRLLFPLLLAGLLAACAATQETGETPAEVVDRSTEAGRPVGEQGADAQTYGAGEDAAGGFSSLDDPSSILSTRVIYFDYDSSRVRDEFREVVEAHAAYLAANPNTTVVLEGHADERGSREYNLALGERRAQSVERQMVLLGASQDQIRTVSFGEERPAVDGHNEAAWSENRRVELVY